jgi:hypothetical protein
MELRDQMDGVVSTARGFTELIAYEFSQNHEAHRLAAERIEQGMMTSGDLLLSMNSWPVENDTHINQREEIQHREVLEDGLRSLSTVLGKMSDCDSLWSRAGVAIGFKEGTPSHISNSIEIYKDLYQQCGLIALDKAE